MIGAATERRQDWLLAAALSVLLHGGLAVWMLDLWPYGAMVPAGADSGPLPEIRITALTIPDNPGATDEPGIEIPPAGQPDDTAVPPAAPDQTAPGAPPLPDMTEPATVDAPPARDVRASAPPAPPPLPETAPDNSARLTDTPAPPEGAASSGSAAQLIDPVAPELVAPEGASASLSPVEPGTGVTVVGGPPPVAGAGAAAPPEVATTPPTPELRALADMLRRIRADLGQGCLLALPQRLSETELGLTVLADTDRGLGAMVDAVTEGLNVPVTRRAVLVDRRQCAAIAFLRAQPSYPAFGLGLGVEALQVSSGTSVRGQIAGAGAGQSVTLLLVDDGGVVQDMGRFLSFDGAGASFDIPVRREGAARDTGQLLIALATAQRPRAVAEHADKLAADFFPALTAELERSGANVAVVSVDIR